MTADQAHDWRAMIAAARWTTRPPINPDLGDWRVMTSDSPPIVVARTYARHLGQEVAELIAGEHNELEALRAFETAVRQAMRVPNPASILVDLTVAVGQLDRARGGDVDA